MRLIVALIFTIILSANTMPGAGYSYPSSGTSAGFAGPEIALHLKSPLISGNSVKLGYEIPYDGYIEFHLYNPDGEQIWGAYEVKEKGEHYQAIRRDKLEEGITYSYEFWYKGKPYKGKFTA